MGCDIITTYIDSNDYKALITFSSTLSTLILESIKNYNSHIVFLCIGTDRSTGDSFGPLVGYKLSKLKHNNIFIYGTLDNPVHAKNLASTIDDIYKSHQNPLIIAIDACLGSFDHIGFIGIRSGPMKPGSGVNKELPNVGDISITGIVNISGFMDYITLQSTRLSLVMKLADIVSIGIRHTIYKLDNNVELLKSDQIQKSTYIIN